MSGGNKWSYTKTNLQLLTAGLFKYIELLLPQTLRVNKKQAVKGERFSEKIGVLGILKHTTFQNTIQLSQPPEESIERCSLEMVKIKF